MASRIKSNSRKGLLLQRVAEHHEWGFVTDRECAPPSSVMKPLKDAGLVYLHRSAHHENVHGGNPTINLNRWFLTLKGVEVVAGL